MREPATGKKQKIFLLMIRMFKAGLALGLNYLDKLSCRQIWFSFSLYACRVGIRRELRQCHLHDAGIYRTTGLKGNYYLLGSRDFE